MPEVILPCPACGNEESIVVTQSMASNRFRMFCVCGHTGQFCDTQQSALEAWNSLPRSLTWTHEPPKVAGWYWCSDNDDSNGYPLISHYDAWAIKEFLPKINDGKTRFKWAGPIVPPIEP